MIDTPKRVLIVGAGISGTSLAYTLARFTGVSHIDVIEKNSSIAAVASSGHSNSQTKHDGSIETNYTLAKAKIVKRTADMLVRYSRQYGYLGKFMQSHQKMTLGVGDKEVATLLKRYEEFKGLYPKMEVFDKARLKKIEPAVVFDADGNERPENIVGVGMASDETTVDFGAMSESFIENAKASKNGAVDVHLNTEVGKIRKVGDTFEVTTSAGIFTADYVVVNAGAASLAMAQDMGYGLNLGCLPIGGSFFMATGKLLNGKVYTVQNPKLPFAAVHGDPDILMGERTRLGPSAKVGIWDGIKAIFSDWRVLPILGGMMMDAEIRTYLIRQYLYEVPFLGKRLFLSDARKIIPSLKLKDIQYAKGFGGIRPQIIDKEKGELVFGNASIDTGEGIVFNMTPSPGATSALGNAETDARRIAEKLGLVFDETRFAEELG